MGDALLLTQTRVGGLWVSMLFYNVYESPHAAVWVFKPPRNLDFEWMQTNVSYWLKWTMENYSVTWTSNFIYLFIYLFEDGNEDKTCGKNIIK